MMRRSAVTKTGFAAAVLFLAGAAVAAVNFDTSMERVLGEYLEIQKALAADSVVGVEVAVANIEAAAKELRSVPVSGEHAAHYENIPRDLLAACEKLRAAGDIESIRKAFKDLSKPISMWATMAKPQHTNVMYCPMEKAGWVQQGGDVANPYTGAKMAGCGEKVGGSDD